MGGDVSPMHLVSTIPVLVGGVYSANREVSFLEVPANPLGLKI